MTQYILAIVCAYIEKWGSQNFRTFFNHFLSIIWKDCTVSYSLVRPDLRLKASTVTMCYDTRFLEPGRGVTRLYHLNYAHAWL